MPARYSWLPQSPIGLASTTTHRGFICFGPCHLWPYSTLISMITRSSSFFVTHGPLEFFCRNFEKLTFRRLSAPVICHPSYLLCWKNSAFAFQSNHLRYTLMATSSTNFTPPLLRFTLCTYLAFAGLYCSNTFVFLTTCVHSIYPFLLQPSPPTFMPSNGSFTRSVYRPLSRIFHYNFRLNSGPQPKHCRLYLCSPNCASLVAYL